MISLPSESDLLSLAIAYFQTAHTVGGIVPPAGPRSFIGQQSRALAGLLGEILGYAKAIDADTVPGGVYVDSAGVTRTRNSSAALDDWAFVLALPSDVSSQYGRHGATAARGGGATGTGSPGVIVATAAQLVDASGTVTLKLRSGFTMGGGGSQAVTLDAVTTGRSWQSARRHCAPVGQPASRPRVDSDADGGAVRWL
jgi:hypothetical protein